MQSCLGQSEAVAVSQAEPIIPLFNAVVIGWRSIYILNKWPPSTLFTRLLSMSKIPALFPCALHSALYKTIVRVVILFGSTLLPYHIRIMLNCSGGKRNQILAFWMFHDVTIQTWRNGDNTSQVIYLGN